MSAICLITIRNVSYNPRLLKEADALCEAGYQVRVVALNTDAREAALDRDLMQDRTWTLDFVDAQRNGVGRATWLWGSLRQRFFQYLAGARVLSPTSSLLDYAYSRYVAELAAAAAAEPAQLYVAHNLAALPAAARAAREHDAKLGFDAEDFHRGEFGDGSSQRLRLTERTEARYLPECDYVTAASDGIAEAYAEVLPIERPTTVLNVFPLSEREGHTPAGALEREKPAGTLSLYWYSQVIGPDRGLQDAVRAVGLLNEWGNGADESQPPVHLVLRGTWAEGFETDLQSLAERCGVADRVHWRPPAPPSQLVERASRHDVGLALEQNKDANNRVAVSNKLFTYLLAGVPVVATDTEGQRSICEPLPEATHLCPIGSPEALAEAVRALTGNEEERKKAKQAARRAGTERYNWDREKEKLMRTIEASLRQPAEVAPGVSR